MYLSGAWWRKFPERVMPPNAYLAPFLNEHLTSFSDYQLNWSVYRAAFSSSAGRYKTNGGTFGIVGGAMAWEVGADQVRAVAGCPGQTCQALCG
jgi:hypothetical protein